ncbi:DMT family transporter, partial [Campylobacter coli]
MLKVIKHNLGIYFMILACLDFALMGACAKILSKEMSSIEIMFFRNIIGVLFIVYLLKRSKVHKEGGHFWLLVFRGVTGTLSLYMFFYNVSNITLGGAFAFQKTAPIFITLIAFIIFKENIGAKGWLGILIAFSGVLLIAQPWADSSTHSGFDLKNSIIGVMSGFLAALALTSVRELRKFYTTEQIAFSFILLGALMPLISMIGAEFFEPKHLDSLHLDFILAPFVMPSLTAWLIIAVMGALGTIYQIHV